MARRIRDTNLESRAGRAKLKPSGKPYYKSIGEGLHLGYRKGRVEGKWVVRRYAGNQAYITDTICTADDIADADGTRILTFWQAQEKARTIGAGFLRAERQRRRMRSCTRRFTLVCCECLGLRWRRVGRRDR